MDSDTDESLDDFKSPKEFSVQGKRGSPKPSGMKQQAAKDEDYPNQKKHFHSNRKMVSFDSNLIQKKRTRGKVISPAKNEASLSAVEKKDCSRCPTCGKIFRIREIIGHAADCLQKNFAVCKGSQEKVGNTSSNSNFGNATSAESHAPLPNKTFFCVSCGSDLTSYSAEQKNIHINRCLDTPSKTAIKGQKQSEKKVSQSVNCPFCLKVLTQRGLKRHLVACQKKNKFSTMAAMSLHRPEDCVDDELLSEIRESEKRPHAIAVGKKVAKTKAKDSRKTNVKKNRETYHDEMMQLAIAVSNNEDLEKKRPRVSKKKQQEVIIPLMITLSPNSKRKQLHTRLHDIAHPERFHSDEDEIPSTPVLPATSLSLSNVSLISSLQNRQPFADDEIPGPSGVSNIQMDKGMDASRCSSSVTCSGPSSSSLKPCDDELQSPEVSSSNMKSTTALENSGNLVTSGSESSDASRNTSDVERRDRQTSTQKVIRSPTLDIRWAVTKSPTPTRPLYHVPGLLSQFDESKKRLMATLSEPNNEMNSTLTTLNALDEDSKDTSAEVERKCGESGLSVSERGSTSQKQHLTSLQPVSSFVKLIDNPQFSDAKILAGPDKEVIYLHKNILFCCCPLLLEEIIGCDNDELYLEKYEKSAILPLIAYIYSRRIESLLSAVSTEHYHKTEQLMEKFGVMVTDCHRRMLDAATEDNTKNLKTSPSKARRADVKKDLERVSSKVCSEHVPLPAEDLIYVKQSKDMPSTSPTSSMRASVEDSTDEAPYSTSTSNYSSITTKSSHNLSSSPTPCTDKDRHDHQIKPKKRNIRNQERTHTRKSLRQVSNIRKRHSNWKTRRCPCCTEDRVEVEDKVHRLRDGMLEKRKHLKRRLCQLHQPPLHLRKRICLSSPRKDQKMLSSVKHRSKVSEGLTSPRRQRYLRRVSLSKLPKNNHPGSASQSVSKHLESRDIFRTKRTRSSERLAQRKVIKIRSTVVKDSSCESKLSSSDGQTRIESRKEPDQPPSITRSNNKDITVDEQGSTCQQNKNMTPKAQTDDDLHRYVTERLPRFKQREYIKNRLGVANMGKSSSKIVKSSKKASTTPARSEYEENRMLECVSSRKEVLPDFYSDEETADDMLSDHSENCVALSSYAIPSPKPIRTKEAVKTDTKVMESENDSLSDIFLDNSFGSQWSDTPVAKKVDSNSNYPSTPPLVISNAEHSHGVRGFNYSHPVLITPMPNFKGMPTPELLRRAKDIGVKQKIGKPKIRAKLEEVFLYHHQVSADQIAASQEVAQEDKSADEDDLRISNIDENNTTLKLSVMSAMSFAANSVYSFSLLSKEKVLRLATAVVDAMHVDGSLLKALEEMKEKTGFIKRGSHQDQKRCWAMVTPGSSGFNVKLSAILTLPEDYITAITTPFVACVVKYYIELKKYQFDCLPAVCDRMEEWFRATEGEGRTGS